MPRDGIYTYFRLHDEQNVMVIMNQNQEDVTIPREVLAEILDLFTIGTSVHDGSVIDVTAEFVAPAMTTSIWDLD